MQDKKYKKNKNGFDSVSKKAERANKLLKPIYQLLYSLIRIILIGYLGYSIITGGKIPAANIISIILTNIIKP